jgi:hypothetical protein
MSEEKKTITDALSGGAAQADTTDWKAKFEEAQHALESAKVEQGRVKKLAEENAKLQKQLAERTTRRPSDYLTDEERKGIDDDQRGIIDKMVDGRVSDAVAASREEIAALKAQLAQQNAERDERDNARRKRELDERFEREFPGLAAQIGPGGDKQSAWANYRRFNGASIDAALASFDFDALAWHVNKFFTDELGIAPPSGGKAPAAPDPGNIGGGKPVTVKPGKTYTWDEIDALYDQIEELRARGDREGMKRLAEEVELAQREGRVK